MLGGCWSPHLSLGAGVRFSQFYLVCLFSFFRVQFSLERKRHETIKPRKFGSVFSRIRSTEEIDRMQRGLGNLSAVRTVLCCSLISVNLMGYSAVASEAWRCYPPPPPPQADGRHRCLVLLRHSVRCIGSQPPGCQASGAILSVASIPTAWLHSIARGTIG